MMTREVVLAGAFLAALAGAPYAQTPQPFPKPGESTRAQPAAPPQRDVKVLPPEPQTPVARPNEPTAETLGLPVYPGAQFLTSYDAGKGQRYYLFGTLAPFDQIVGYYRTVLKQRGNLVYEAPRIHMFEVGRFREETMAFPPGVTVKDYTWGGSPGYLNPQRGAEPAHYPTVIQIVPPPAGVGR